MKNKNGLIGYLLVFVITLMFSSVSRADIMSAPSMNVMRVDSYDTYIYVYSTLPQEKFEKGLAARKSEVSKWRLASEEEAKVFITARGPSSEKLHSPERVSGMKEYIVKRTTVRGQKPQIVASK